VPSPARSRDEVVARITQLFRDEGYEGASLSRISAATGLGRSSLYHHFPKGKEDMAAAALAQVAAFFQEHLLGPLTAPGAPRDRLARFAKGLDAFYASGRTACLVNVFCIGDARTVFRPGLAQRLKRLMRALADLAAESGIAPGEAARRAEDAVIALHGALVVGRALNTNAPFRRLLAELPDRVLRPAKR
jgi:TetR/AcrR family transcriptional repressor of lmrAB and yxaGH operons